jgi:hypothetical protein
MMPNLRLDAPGEGRPRFDVDASNVLGPRLTITRIRWR